MAGVTIIFNGTQVLTTNATGVATINLYNGDYTWAINLDGYDPESGDFTIENAPYPIDVELFVGIGDVAANLVKLYPNPVSDYFNITINNNLNIEKVEFIGITGKLIKETNFINNSISLSEH